MKLPRNVSGATLQASLRRLGYDTVRQRGSHVRITTQINGEHHEVIPLHTPITSQIAIGRVTGPYRYAEVNTAWRHTRPVEWVRLDIPRATFEQDLLYSFGAFMTVCNISRNDAARRVAAVLEGKPDPGLSVPTKAPVPTEIDTPEVPDLTQLAHDQIVARIQSRFTGHALARLVAAVLQADGWETKIAARG